MSSNSVDEDEPIVPLLFDDDSEDYKATCDYEVNDMVPRLERLHISDETIHLSCDMNMPESSVNTVPSSINEASIADSNEKSTIFFGDTLDQIYENKTSLFETLNTQVVNRSQKDIQKAFANEKMYPIDVNEEYILDKPKENGPESICDEVPLDFSTKRNLNYNNEAKSISEISEDKSVLQSPSKMKPVDSGTSETIKNLNIILPGTSSRNSRDEDLDQSADEMSNAIIVDIDSLKLSYSADVSSDDHSHSSGIVIDSSPKTLHIGVVKATLAEDKCSRKIAVYSSPVSGISKNRRRRFGIIQPQSKDIDLLRKNSSDEDNSSVIRKDSPINVRRKCKKTVKTSPTLAALNNSDPKQEEKMPSPYKRKKTSSDTMMEPTGKFRKRSISEHYSKTGKKTQLVIRSRSLSPGSTNMRSIPITNLPVGNLTAAKTRKRMISDCYASHDEFC